MSSAKDGDSVSTPSNIAWFDRFIPIPGLIATSAVAYTLLGLKVTGWRSSERFANLVTTDRTSVAIVVQIMSHLFGLIQVQALCTVLRLSFTTSVSSQAFSLNLLQFVHAGSIPRLSFSLPWFLSLPLFTFVMLSFLPAALWSGAVTPVLAESITTQTILVPTFHTSNLSSLWKGNTSTATSGSGTLGQWLTPQGLFSFDPSAMRSLILNSASDASTNNATDYLHPKLDKTGFSYANRSYGAGSAAGLVDIAGSNLPRWLSFPEVGFHSQVSCIYNTSTAYRIERLQVPMGWSLSVYQAEGSYPNGAATGGWVYAGYSPDDIFSWGAIYSQESRKSYVSVATGATASKDSWAFNDFNNIQCEIGFKATANSVLVNFTSKIISVTPGEDVPWPSYADEVIDKVTNWLWVFSFVDSSFGGSYLGRTLRVSVNQLQNSTGDFSATTTLHGVSNYLTSCIDNVLVSLSSARLVAANATAPVRAQIATPAVTFGDQKYIYSILVVNVIVCLVYCIEAIRTRFWHDMPQFQLLDLASMVIAAWRGGITISRGAPDTLYSYCSPSSFDRFDSGLHPKDLSFALGVQDNNRSTIVPVAKLDDRD